jgi:hypothetical protein
MPPTNADLLLDPNLSVAATRELPTTRRASLLAEAPALASKLLASEVDDRIDASIVFDTVAKVMAIAVKDHDADLFTEGVASLVEIWKEGKFEALLPTTPPEFEASLWENLGINLYALGGLAIAEERWAELRELTTQSPTGGSAEKSWLRQAQVASSRANHDYPEESVFRHAVKRLQMFDDTLTYEQAESLLARFDLISGLIISEEGPRGFFPNAAELPATTVEPFVIEQVREPNAALREHVFAGNPDGLRAALAEYDRMARTQAALARYVGQNWAWRGFSDARTLVFIAEGHKLEEWSGPPAAGD